MRLTPVPRSVADAVLDAHPIATLVVGADFKIAHANAAARKLLAVHAGVKLGEALGCVEAQRPGGCGAHARCGGCAFRRAVTTALGGAAARERGFVLRGGDAQHLPDLHLLAFAGPLERDGARLAVLALDDANAILGDPGVVHVCEGCGRVRDEEGAWHPLHRYLQDRLGVEAGALCDACAAGTGGGAGARRRGPGA